MSTEEINKRYSKLAGTDCCLSCGGAVDLAVPREGEICVDLGSGRGTDVIRIAQMVGDEGFVFGFDVSEGMIEKSKANAVKFDIKNVTFIHSELTEINLPDQSADLVVSNCTINHIADKQSLWNEIYRILKKGGRFVVSDIYACEEIAEEYRNSPEAVAECWAGAVPKEENLHIIKQAGFKSFEIIEESKPYTKGQTVVASYTIKGVKPSCCCCG